MRRPFCNWNGNKDSSSIPWIAADGKYSALIMTQQADMPTAFIPSENLKAKLEPLIRQALTSNPPPIRLVP